MKEGQRNAESKTTECKMDGISNGRRHDERLINPARGRFPQCTRRKDTSALGGRILEIVHTRSIADLNSLLRHVYCSANSIGRWVDMQELCYSF